MFIDVHVNVTMPGRSFNSKSSTWGPINVLQIGLILEIILSYSFKT